MGNSVADLYETKDQTVAGCRSLWSVADGLEVDEHLAKAQTSLGDRRRDCWKPR